MNTVQRPPEPMGKTVFAVELFYISYFDNRFQRNVRYQNAAH